MRADGVGDGGMGKWGGKAWTMAGWDEGEEGVVDGGMG